MVLVDLNSFICGDCMDYLPEFPDKYFDLSICDPPYGIGIGEAPGGATNSTSRSAERRISIGGANPFGGRKRNQSRGGYLQATQKCTMRLMIALSRTRNISKSF